MYRKRVDVKNCKTTRTELLRQIFNVWLHSFGYNCEKFCVFTLVTFSGIACYWTQWLYSYFVQTYLYCAMSQPTQFFVYKLIWWNEKKNENTTVKHLFKKKKNKSLPIYYNDIICTEIVYIYKRATPLPQIMSVLTRRGNEEWLSQTLSIPESYQLPI